MLDRYAQYYGLRYTMTVTEIAVEGEWAYAVAEPSQAGGQIAYIGEDGNVWLVNIDGSEPRQITFDAEPGLNVWEPIASYRDPKWSPDGSKLAFVRSERIDNTSGEAAVIHTLIVADQDGTTLTPVLTEFEGYYDWSPQADRIVYSEDDSLWILSVQTWESVRFLSSGSGQPLGWVDWSPDGARIAFEEHRLLPGDECPFGCGYAVIAVAEAATGQYVYWDPFQVVSCSWAPDGSALVCSADAVEYCGELLDVRDPDGTSVQMLGPFFDHWAAICSPLWSPDGRYITFSSQFERLPALVVDASTGQTRMVTSFNATPISWSPSGSHLLVNTSPLFHDQPGTIYSVDVDSGETQEIAQGGDASWQPPVRGPSVGDLLTRKQAAMTSLEQTSVEIVGLQFPIGAYDETEAGALIQHIQSEAESGSLSPGQVEAFARLTVQEEGLAGLLPLYSQTSADLSEVGADVVGILLSLNREADRALEACYASGNSFSGACLTLRRLIDRQVLRVISSLVRAAIRFIPDSQQREEFRQFWNLLVNGVSLELDAAHAMQDILLNTVVKGPAVDFLVHQYVEAVQPSLDQGVRSADRTYAGPEPIWTVEGQLERAELHIEGNAEQAAIQAEHAHDVHQDLMRGADVAQLLTDIADIGQLSPWAALAQITGIAARMEHLFVDTYAIAVNVNSMNCTRYLSTRAGSFAFNPDQPGESCRDISGSLPSSPRMAQVSSRGGDAAAWEAAWSRITDDVETYENAVRDLLAALSRGDPQAVTEASTVLDEGDQALGFSTQQAVSIILDSDVPDSKAIEVLSQSNQFTLDALELYLSVAGYLTAPQNERSITGVEQAASTVLSSLEEYGEALQAAAPSGGESRPLPVIQAVVLPDAVVVEEPFDVTVAVWNIGSADANEVMVRVQAAGQEVQVAGIETPETNRVYTTTLQAQASHTGTLTLLIEVAMGDSVTDSRIDQVQAGLEAPGEAAGRRPRCCAGFVIALPIITAVLLIGRRSSGNAPLRT